MLFEEFIANFNELNTKHQCCGMSVNTKLDISNAFNRKFSIFKNHLDSQTRKYCPIMKQPHGSRESDNDVIEEN
jgi:hypothetical protein